MTKDELTIIYYTSNHLEDTNPQFLKNTLRQLVMAIGDMPLIAVSLRPMDRPEGYKGQYTNLVAGKDFTPRKEGRHHLNIYYQIMIGAKHAKTKYVAMAEDDILYSESHFHSGQIKGEFEAHGDVFLYDMNKVSLFTWSNPPIFSYRSKRMVVNQLICPARLLVDSLEERFARLDKLLLGGKSEEKLIGFWGDPGRYEKQLGVTIRPTIQFYSQMPSIVFSHEHAYGYLSQGKRKRHGDIKIVELYDWGRAENILKLFYGN